MNDLKTYHQSLGANLADDGIPLYYDDLQLEYQTALDACIILDRSHEGRLFLTGDSRFELVNRMSTNKIIDMPANAGQATVFTNPNARILYRVIVYNRPEGLLLITEPGQGDAVASYLGRNIFYGDTVKLINIQAQTNQFAIHGQHVDELMSELSPDLKALNALDSAEVKYDDLSFTVVRRKAIVGQHWAILCQQRDAVAIHQLMMEKGLTYRLKPAGSLTYNTLRIRSGRPAGLELSNDYIPLEVGLWDEVSFSKGCYTGQEIIARMESRQKLARTIVQLALSDFIQAPIELYYGRQKVGTVTSSVKAPDGEIYAIGVVKTDYALPDTQLTINESVTAIVTAYAGEQPDFIVSSS